MNKKNFSFLSLFFVIILSINTFAQEVSATVVVDEKAVLFDTPIQNVDGYTYTPLRAVLEAINSSSAITYSLDEKGEYATIATKDLLGFDFSIKYAKNYIDLGADINYVTSNSAIDLTTTPSSIEATSKTTFVLSNGRILVKLRDVLEHYNGVLSIDYDAETKMITVVR